MDAPVLHPFPLFSENEQSDYDSNLESDNESSSSEDNQSDTGSNCSEEKDSSSKDELTKENQKVRGKNLYYFQYS